MSSVSKKRCKSQAGLEDSYRDQKRMKIDHENVKKEILEHHSTKKKQKHAHRGGINAISDVKDSKSWNVLSQQVTTDNHIEDSRQLLTKHQQNRGVELTKQSSRQEESLPDIAEECSLQKKKKKKKHQRHVDDDCIGESKSDQRHGSIELVDNDKETVSTSGDTLQQEETSNVHTKKKKKKKKHQQHVDDDDCIIETEVETRHEVLDLVDTDEMTGAQPADITPHVLEEMSETQKKKKKKKKHHSNDDDEGPCFVPVLKSLEKHAKVHQKMPSFSQQQPDFSNSSSMCERSAKRLNPVQLHIATHDLRFKPGHGFKERVPDASKDGLWWEDIGVDPNLEMWLVRAPVDFPASILDGTRAAIDESFLIPELERPSKLVVLVPSKQDKKLHVASDVNGYVSIVRAETLKIENNNQPTLCEDQAGVEVQKRKKKKRKSDKNDNDAIISSSRK